METNTIDIQGLSELLKIAVGTIRNRLSARPDTLPEPLSMHGRRLLWLRADVDNWLKQRSPYFVPEQKKAGRPRATSPQARRA